MRFLGIDVSKATLDWATVATVDGDVLAEGSVPNTERGIPILVAAHAADELTLIVVEATGAYHRPLLTALVAAELPVTLVNPLQIVGFRKVRLGRAKTDRQDARLLARFGATYATELRRSTPPSAEPAHLRAWTRYRASLIRQQTRLAGQREANDWAGDAPVQHWLTADAESIAAKIAVVDAAIDALLARIPEALVVMAIKGVGPKLTAAVLGNVPFAMWGDAKKAAAFVGVVPRVEPSGKRSHSRISKAGPGEVRRILWMAARSAINDDPAIRAWYDGLLARGKPEHQAHCAVMHKLLRHMMGRLNAWQTGQLGTAGA
jgi:transposase